ncbi:MAG: thioesterase family protein [Bacillota bacterium]|nr:thioesterase family protein [Bacillota bacterium]
MKCIEIERQVTDSHLAINMKSGSLEVLATPQMIAWMEEASCLCLDLEEGMTSVGTMMNVSHEKASPKGAIIRICAKILQEEGRKVVFEVQAFQGDVCIGRGKHERFIVNAKRFLEKTYA